MSDTIQQLHELPDLAARADRPDQTRNLDRTPLPDRSTRRIK